MRGTCSTLGSIRNSYKFLSDILTRRNHLGVLSLSDIKINVKEIGCEVVDWIYLAEFSIHWWVLLSMVPDLRDYQVLSKILLH
jgi:hypothetical protein